MHHLAVGRQRFAGEGDGARFVEGGAGVDDEGEKLRRGPEIGRDAAVDQRHEGVVAGVRRLPSNPEDAILPGKGGAGPIGGLENLPYVDTIGSPLVGPRGGTFMGGQRGAEREIKRLIRDLG